MQLVKYIIRIGYIVAGVLLLYSLTQLLLTNSLMDIFSFKETQPDELIVTETSNSNIKIDYTFTINNKSYHGNQLVFNKIFRKQFPTNEGGILINYNEQFPQISFIKQLEIQSRTGFVGLIFSLLLAAFIFLVDKFMDKPKWVNRYNKALANKRNGA